MKYLPESYDCRTTLASLLTDRLLGWGFSRIYPPRTTEHVYAREEEPNLFCHVYTTIEGRQCRAKDKDAIRVCLVYTGGEKPKGCGKDRRVYRVGELEEIPDRAKDRIDNITKDISRCNRCGAPTFRSKKGNDVCAALCWTKENGDAEPRTGAGSGGATGGARLSDDARKLLAALVGDDDVFEWWTVVPDKIKRNAALDELRDYALIEVDEGTGMCRATDRGVKSYDKAKEAGLVA